MRRFLVIWLLLIPVLAVGQVYKWADADGKVHYSDRPVMGAEAVGIAVRKTQPPPERPVPGRASPGPYVQFEILTPEANATLRDAEGNVQVGLVLEPQLMEGHRLQVVVDGAPVSGDVPGTQLVIKGLPFGSHQLQAQILDPRGTLIATTSVIGLHLRKPNTP